MQKQESRGGYRQGAGRKPGSPNVFPSIRKITRENALQLIQGEINQASPLLAKTLTTESVGLYVILKKSIMPGAQWQVVKDDADILEALGELTAEEGYLKPFAEKDGYYIALRKEKPNMKALEIALAYAFGKPNTNITVTNVTPELSIALKHYRSLLESGISKTEALKQIVELMDKTGVKVTEDEILKAELVG